MEDKIDLRLGSWSVFNLEEKDDFKAFKDILASPSGGPPYVDTEETDLHGSFFLRPSSIGIRRTRLYIRTNRMNVAGSEAFHNAPLCGGFCQFKRFYNSKSSEGIEEKPSHRLHLDLSLNLQRYMRHQPVNDEPAEEGALNGTPRLERRDGDRSHHGREFSFDGSDNWTPKTPSWRKFATPKNSRTHFDQYLGAIGKKMRDELSRACKVARKRPPFGLTGIFPKWKNESPYYSLNRVETFWEFPSKKPIFETLRIGSRLAHAKKDWGKARNYRFSFKEAGRQFNSPCFTLPIAENTELKIYPKTNKRIRFEVCHLLNTKKQRTALLREVGIVADKDDFPLDELPKLMEALRERAAKMMNGVMEILRQGKSVEVKALSVVELLSEVANAIPAELTEEEKAEQIQMILFLIFYQGGFRGNSKTGPLAPAIEKLRKRQVLKWSHSLRFYQVHDSYQSARESLRAGTGDPFISLLGAQITPDGIHKIGKYYVHLRE